jgi:hypothetical protein
MKMKAFILMLKKMYETPCMWEKHKQKKHTIYVNKERSFYLSISNFNHFRSYREFEIDVCWPIFMIPPLKVCRLFRMKFTHVTRY